MKQRSLYIVAGFAVILSAVWAVLGIRSASSAALASGHGTPPSIDEVQMMLIQGAFTSSYVTASLAFLLIGMLGLAIAHSLKTLEARVGSAANR